MKNMFESGEIFEAFARIELRYYGIEQLYKEMQKPRSGLEVLIDEQTGYGKFRTKEDIKTATELIEGVIADKKLIEADYSKDEEFLLQLKSFTP